MLEKCPLFRSAESIGQILGKRGRPPNRLKYIEKSNILPKPNPARTGLVFAGFFYAKNDDLAELVSKEIKMSKTHFTVVYGRF